MPNIEFKGEKGMFKTSRFLWNCRPFCPFFDKANYLNFIMIAVVFIGYKAIRLTMQTMAATIYLIFLTYVVLFVW